MKGSLITLSYGVEKVRGEVRAANAGIGVGMTVAAVTRLAALVVLKYYRCSGGNYDP